MTRRALTDAEMEWLFNHGFGRGALADIFKGSDMTPPSSSLDHARDALRAAIIEYDSIPFTDTRVTEYQAVDDAISALVAAVRADRPATEVPMTQMATAKDWNNPISNRPSCRQCRFWERQQRKNYTDDEWNTLSSIEQEAFLDSGFCAVASRDMAGYESTARAWPGGSLLLTRGNFGCVQFEKSGA